MTTDDARCQEVLSTARGDDSDGPELRKHVERCESCRAELSDFRTLARVARSALQMDPSIGLSNETLKRARRRPVHIWGRRAAFAAAAAVAVAFALLGPRFAEPRRAQLVLDVPPPADGGLRYVLTGPGGSTTGDLRSATQPEFVLETVAVNAMVLDTF